MNRHASNLIVALATCIAFSVANFASAEIIYVLPDVIAEADGINPTVGEFFVSIEVDEPNPPQIVGYNVDFDVVGGSVILVSAADVPGPWSLGNFSDENSQPTQNIRVFDFADDNGIAALSGALAKVSFTIPANVTEGTFPLNFGSLALQDQQNVLTTATGEVLLPDDVRMGSITVVDLNQDNIPEPSSLVLLAIFGVLGFIRLNRRA